MKKFSEMTNEEFIKILPVEFQEEVKRRMRSFLGSIKTEKKSKSSAENGKKGGRPRKVL